MHILKRTITDEQTTEKLGELGGAFLTRMLRAKQAEEALEAVAYFGTHGVFDGQPKIASDAVAKPEALKKKMDGVSLGKDKKGYYVFTHRARSSSYPTPEAIPDSKIKFIESTG